MVKNINHKPKELSVAPSMFKLPLEAGKISQVTYTFLNRTKKNLGLVCFIDNVPMEQVSTGCFLDFDPLTLIGTFKLPEIVSGVPN